jgi:hypothetical protein
MLVKISACGVCHTELNEIEGRTPTPQFPLLLGHQVVGKVEKAGRKAKKLKLLTGLESHGFIQLAVNVYFAVERKKTCVKNLGPPSGR